MAKEYSYPYPYPNANANASASADPDSDPYSNPNGSGINVDKESTRSAVSIVTSLVAAHPAAPRTPAMLGDPQPLFKRPSESTRAASLYPPFALRAGSHSPPSPYGSSIPSSPIKGSPDDDGCAMTDPESFAHSSQAEKGHREDRHGRSFRHTKRQHPLNPEKADTEHAETMPPYDSAPNSHHTTITYTCNDMFGEASAAEEHTMWILIYLSFLSPLLTLPISLYTLLLTPMLILLSPLSLCTSYASFSAQFSFFLSPPLTLQLSLIASTIDPAFCAANPFLLILIHIFSPLYAFAIAISAWIAAIFWAYAAILGDPGGRDGKDDGRATVLGVRRWWERWLERGLRSENEE